MTYSTQCRPDKCVRFSSLKVRGYLLDLEVHGTIRVTLKFNSQGSKFRLALA